MGTGTWGIAAVTPKYLSPRLLGLHLGTPVRWVEEVQEYYIKKSITKI